MKQNSFFKTAMNPDFRGQFRGLTAQPNRRLNRASRGNEASACLKSRIYSAAAANAGFAVADDTMKSEMRGTISDLKRDPLNTP
jgi:hypothetical protein